MGPDPDAALMLAFQQGDEGAFRTLFERHARAMFAFCHHFVRDAARAEELAQDVFVNLYRASGRSRPSARVTTYAISDSPRRDESDSPRAFPMLASVLTVGDDTFRSMALMAVADIPLFSDRSWRVRPFRFRMLLILLPTSIMIAAYPPSSS